MMQQPAPGVVPPPMAPPPSMAATPQTQQQYQYQQPPAQPQQPYMMMNMMPPQRQPPMWQPQQGSAPVPAQQHQAGQPASADEVRTLWIGDLQYYMDENYLLSCFSQTGEVFNGFYLLLS